MACRLFDTILLSELVGLLLFGTQGFQWNMKQNTNIAIKEYEFDNVCKMAAIFFSFSMHFFVCKLDVKCQTTRK